MTVYYPLKCISTSGIVLYETTPYDVVGTWKAFSSFKDRLQFFSKCFLSERKCAHYCIKQMVKENKK